MSGWLYWTLLAIVLTIGEVATPGLFFLAPIAVAAIAAAIAAAAGGTWIVDVGVFAVGSVVSLGVLRPLARRHIYMPPELRTGAAALVGARAIVTEQVDVNGGHVKIGGEVWSARALDETAVIEVGAEVQVAEIKGATALVYR